MTVWGVSVGWADNRLITAVVAEADEAGGTAVAAGDEAAGTAAAAGVAAAVASGPDPCQSELKARIEDADSRDVDAAGFDAGGMNLS